MRHRDSRSTLTAFRAFVRTVGAAATALSVAWVVIPAAGAAEPADRGLARAKNESPAWVYTGSMLTPRSYHTATLLAGGKVLVAGGWEESGGVFSAAELYDPVAGTWSATGSMRTPLASHTATRLLDGRVLVVGSVFAQPELYDPARGVWVATGGMITPRTGHTATLLRDGSVLVAGGLSTGSAIPLNTTELFDPATQSWRESGHLIVGRYGHSATRLLDGSVLVARGPDSSAEIYDPVVGTWSTAGRSIASGSNHAATLLPDGRVLVTGGASANGDPVPAPTEIAALAEVFDPATRTWRRGGSLVIPRSGHSATGLPGGRVLITGGTIVDPAAVEQFEAGGGQSTPAASLNEGRFGHTATLLDDGRVLVAGGHSHGGASHSAELYAAPPPGTITPGYTGAWFDPAQSGHGLSIQVLAGNRFLASWFAFDPAGTRQAWFLGVGTYQDNVAEVADVRMPTGGRWIPNFNPSAVASGAWGTLRFTFDDCDHGRVDFVSVAGFGSGSMKLTRLTQPAGLTCP